MNSQSFFLTHAHGIESPENSGLLEEIKEPLWAYLRQQCPSFLERDCNARFSQIFEEKTFGKLTPDEMNIFSSLEQTKEIKITSIGSKATTTHINISNKTYAKAPLFTLSKEVISTI